MLLDGTYRAAYIELYGPSSEPVLACPATIKFVPGENPDEGEYKVSSDNVVMTALGILKGRFLFVRNTLMTTNSDNSLTHFNVLNGKDSGCIFFNIRDAKIPGLEDKGKLGVCIRIFY